ncbi:integrase [Salmonella enterica subsp. enterica]|nr:integrase [Salmonella enterica subsp. enterica serovar Ealing]
MHDVAGRIRQHLTKIMRHAVQQGTIKYNPAFDLDGVVTPVVTQHHPALPLKRLPELLGYIDTYNKAGYWLSTLSAVPHCQDDTKCEFTHLVRVSLAYRKIEWKHVSTGTSGADDWRAPLEA